MNRFEMIAKKMVAGLPVEDLFRDIDKLNTDYDGGEGMNDEEAVTKAVAICKSFILNNKNVKPTSSKWGFDKIHFRTAENFAKVLAAGGVSVLQEPKHGSMGEFIWKGTGVAIVCFNNPITGEYAQPNQRGPEKGYGGYMGIEGNPDRVEAVVKAAKKYGKYEDESPNARDFI